MVSRFPSSGGPLQNHDPSSYGNGISQKKKVFPQGPELSWIELTIALDDMSSAKTLEMRVIQKHDLGMQEDIAS
jgi:hypothetical protein